MRNFVDFIGRLTAEETKQLVLCALTELTTDDALLVLKGYIASQAEVDQHEIADALVGACSKYVQDNIGESYFNADAH